MKQPPLISHPGRTDRARITSGRHHYITGNLHGEVLIERDRKLKLPSGFAFYNQHTVEHPGTSFTMKGQTMIQNRYPFFPLGDLKVVRAFKAFSLEGMRTFQQRPGQ